jgi:tetratricopeptide (TPR) repeat protein
MLFERLARDEPLIVLLDDIHWAEPALLDLIEYVSTFAREARLLLLCSARPDLFDQRPAWATPRQNAVLVALEPLAAAESEVLVDELREVPEATKARIVEAAEGNPLFVEQLVAMQGEQPDQELVIPPTVQALLAARIDRLDVGERAVLERAAVEGRVFHRGTVQELLPDHARAGVGAHLMTLVRKEFIAPDRALIPGDDAFRFGHNLIREAAYGSLPKKLRAELHERFADRYASLLGHDALGETIGYHLELASRYLLELGSNDEHAHDLALRAGRALDGAGRGAYARGDDGTVRALLARAVALFDDEDPELPAVLARLADSTYEAGDATGALELSRRAQAIAGAVGERGVELWARMDELAVGVRVDPTVETAAAHAEAREAIAELERLGDVEAQARAWRAVIEIGFVSDDMRLVDEASAHLLGCARRTGIRRDEVWAVRGLVAALTYGPAPVPEAIARAEEALAGFPQERAGEDHLALLYAFAGRFADADRAMDRSRRVREELGQTLDHAGLTLDLTWIALLAGRPERAELELRAAAEVMERAGEQDMYSSIAGLLAEVLYRTGRDDEAVGWTERSERAAPRGETWRGTRAKVLARRGEAEEALRLSAGAVEAFRGSESLPFVGFSLSDHAEVLSLLGRPDEARSVLEDALAVYERKGIIPAIHRTRTLLAGPPPPRSS